MLTVWLKEMENLVVVSYAKSPLCISLQLTFSGVALRRRMQFEKNTTISECAWCFGLQDGKQSELPLCGWAVVLEQWS